MGNVGQGFLPSTSNALGRAQRKVGGVSNKLYSMGPQQLNDVAEKLMQNPSWSAKGQALQDAINSNDMAKKNAILFSILQDPNIRLSLGDEQDQSEQ